MAGAALPTALLHKGLQMIFSLAAVFCFGFQTEYPPPEYFFNVKTQFCWQFLSLKNQCYFTTFFAIAQDPAPNKIRRMNIAFHSGIRYNELYIERPPAQTRSPP